MAHIYLEFNCVYLLQSIPDTETQTSNDLINTIRYSLYKLNGITQELIDIASRNEFLNAFQHIFARLADEGVFPYIHFDMHGSKKGLQLKNGEIIIWEELSPLLVKINVRTRNRLFISLSSCFGYYLFNATNPMERVPFYAYIGPPSTVLVGAVEKDWTNYFTILFETKDFLEALKALNADKNSFEYAFLSGEKVWKIMVKGFLSLTHNRKQKREKLYDLVNRAKEKGTNKTEAELLAFFKKNIDYRPLFVRKLKAYSLMKTDTFPNVLD